MKDILEKLVGLIPAYFAALLPLVAGPKRFILERLAKDEPALPQALIFLAVSFVLGWILKIPFNRGDPLLELGTDAAFDLMVVIAYGIALFSAWRIVGSRIDLQKFLTVHFYFAGIFLLLMTMLFLGIVGTIRVFDPVLFKQLLDVSHAGNLTPYLTQNMSALIASTAFRMSSLVQVFGLGVMLVWTVAVWGAYRQLSGLSRLRSFWAGLLFSLFCFPVTAFVYVIANALVK